ncbi:hypothetical protein BT96DRAFT_834403 [Gymnopus androsaceus JB14]|uniref:Uncharacterized protein n=1 Tax=Gymnopus androsaceus JB14 TaxID=1447944 RepID=A0A6A4GVM9_9AGAR|nr:hypothetical protein BT96DRAFT_834403 [Gymnopus androsaceus JB14]
MGIIVYLFVFGELVDAFQSRDMAHRDRAAIAIRTTLFLQTWRKFLAKMGYSEKRHFISAAAYNICLTCKNSLLALMFIHRDHLPQKLPLIPHKHVTEFIEHIFAEMRKLIPDFNMQQALLCVPKLARMSKTSSSSKFSKPTYKKTANGYSHDFLNDRECHFDYELLKTFPSDVEFSAIYKTAVEENHAIWGLL